MADSMPGSPESGASHWAATRSLMWIVLTIWVLFSFVIHFFATPLNGVSFIGFPLGFYLAGQGSLIIFVVVIFWYAARQNSIDEEHGVAED
jgi:putative solute:sodium symporter small subunit